MFEFAPAKVNLALHLRRRRPDGYHDIETVFAFADFGDTLSVGPAQGLSLDVTGPFAIEAGGGGDNLVMRAARALADASGVEANAALALDKQIPVAAGLGGGSADAAATLRLLNRYWELHWSDSWLVDLAADLGSDVPACVLSRTQFGTGRGEELTDWPAGLSGTPMLLANPGVSVPTGPVFAGWSGVDEGGIAVGAALPTLRNDMTRSALAIAPAIGDVLVALESAGGAFLVRMSGSGATCLALYHEESARDVAADTIAAHGWWTARTALL